jgi:hypothetical protein
LTSVFLRATLGARLEEVHVPKSDLPIGGEYAPVADRIALFYERFPGGRIITQLTMHNDREVVFRASVYRTETSRTPAATGWASERVGDGDINTVACLENTETSAIGRALANLGFTASRNRPSLEEMEKAARARRRQGAPALDVELQQVADARTDLIAMLRTARRYGIRPARARRWHDRFLDPSLDRRTAARFAQLLRRFIAGHLTQSIALGVADDPTRP